jgi:hypothetical protein
LSGFVFYFFGYYYKVKQGDKDYFEALYNCNMALRSYYNEIKLKETDIDTSVNNVIKYVKNLDIPELSAVWS